MMVKQDYQMSLSKKYNMLINQMQKMFKMFKMKPNNKFQDQQWTL